MPPLQEPSVQQRAHTEALSSEREDQHVKKIGMHGRWFVDVAPKSSWVMIATTLTTTTVLWAAAKFTAETPQDLWPWRGLSQITILWTVTLMAVAMLAVVRAQALDPVFGGLDRAVRFHRIIGPLAIILVVLHVIFLALAAVQFGTSLGDVFIPFWSRSTRSIDIAVFYLLMLLVALAYKRNMAHERWLSVHRLIGLLLLGSTVHAAFEPGTIADFEPLRTWMVVLLLVGAAAWLYQVLLFRRFGPRYRYRLEKIVTHGNDILDLVMRPVERRMIYEPGTFVFLQVPDLKGHERELHPFSLSSSPVDRDVRLSVRMIGEFTRQLASMEAGRLLDIHGPFGGFTPHRYARYRRLVCIGNGIGITPFLGMLAFELSNKDFRRIWLYYVVRNEKDAVYDKEISDRYLSAESYIDYVLWPTALRGRITAAAVDADVKPLDNYAVMLSGRSDFVTDLAGQFRALGVPRERIITEEFNFH